MNTSLTIIDQVKEIEVKYGAPLEFALPTAIALATKADLLAKPVTEEEREQANEIRRELGVYRRQTSEYFLAVRADFNRLAKGVITVEKEVLSKFEPAEARLKAFNDEFKAEELMNMRLAALPAKLERIATAGIVLSKEDILPLDDIEFELAFARMVSEKAVADAEATRVALASESARIAEAQAKLDLAKREADEADARRVKEEVDRAQRLVDEENARKARAEQEETARLARIADEETARLAKIEAERVAAEQAEVARLADEKYQSWLSTNEYNEATDIILEETLYRKIATYERN